jgi:hypothetical protein
MSAARAKNTAVVLGLDREPALGLRFAQTRGTQGEEPGVFGQMQLRVTTLDPRVKHEGDDLSLGQAHG